MIYINTKNNQTISQRLIFSTKKVQKKKAKKQNKFFGFLKKAVYYEGLKRLLLE